MHCIFFLTVKKSMEAELVAGVIATLLAVPEITELLKVSLLLGWAYAESLYDVKTLLEGGKIPLIKDDATWHFGLQGALEANISNENFREETGLSYEDYLRIFFNAYGHRQAYRPGNEPGGGRYPADRRKRGFSSGRML